MSNRSRRGNLFGAGKGRADPHRARAQQNQERRLREDGLRQRVEAEELSQRLVIGEPGDGRGAYRPASCRLYRPLPMNTNAR